MDKRIVTTIKETACVCRQSSERASKIKVVNQNDESMVVVESDGVVSRDIVWTTYNENNLNYAYGMLFSKSDADKLLRVCESEVVYDVGSQIKIFGKTCDIPRKQVAFGDVNVSYTFSGVTVPAKPWPEFLLRTRDRVAAVSGESYNFVLLNRYEDGNDYIGEHKDNEKDIVPGSTIASVSLGETRDFVFKHQDMRGRKQSGQLTIERVKLKLGHGSLLLMKRPTNDYWYHSLPKRVNARNVRVNMTFRNLIIKS